MRIALLEDDQQEKEEFISALQGWDPTRTAECYNSIEDLIAEARKEPYFTVAFLDVYLPKESGMDAARQMLSVSPKTEIVFTTTSTSHAIEAFSMNALHYLVKPITTDKICDVFDRIRKKQNARPELLLKTGKTSQMIYLEDIAYISSDNHHVQIFLRKGGELSVYMRLSDIQQQLNDSFLKVQRGVIVNADFIERMQRDVCVLKNGVQIMLSRKDRDEIRAAYDDFIFFHLSGRTGFTV